MLSPALLAVAAVLSSILGAALATWVQARKAPAEIRLTEAQTSQIQDELRRGMMTELLGLRGELVAERDRTRSEQTKRTDAELHAADLRVKVVEAVALSSQHVAEAARERSELRERLTAKETEIAALTRHVADLEQQITDVRAQTGTTERRSGLRESPRVGASGAELSDPV